MPQRRVKIHPKGAEISFSFEGAETIVQRHNSPEGVEIACSLECTETIALC